MKGILLFGLWVGLSLSGAQSYGRSYDDYDVQPYQSPVDKDLSRVCGSRRGAHFLEAKHLPVVEILPDDLRGSKHQHWLMKLSSGQTIEAVYNIDEWPRIPVRKGDRVDVGGEVIWTERGCMIHWLHEDPAHRRPDGYVILNGITYGLEK